MKCVFDEALRCVYCGWQARSARTRRVCGTVPAESPGPFEVLSSYARAVAGWIQAGRPVRPAGEIETLFAICEKCPYFSGTACNKCGCRINRGVGGWRNKLAMATEACPIGKWGASEPVTRAAAVRVGFVLPDMRSSGGVYSWLQVLCEHLPQQGVSVSGVAFLGTTDQIDSAGVERLGVPVVGPVELPGVHRVWRAEEAIYSVGQGSDVLVVWSLGATHASACRSLCKTVGVSHGCSDWWMRDSASHIDHWVAVGSPARAPVPSEQCTVIPNGIDLARLNVTLSREVLRSEVGLPQAAKVLVSVGRIAREKRLGLAVQALERLPADHWLWLVGDGRDSLPQHDRLIVTPSRSDIGNIYHAADCALLLSQAEGYCLSAVEALASGIPLVATPVGILPQLDREVGRSVARYLSLDPSPEEVARSVLQSLASHVPSADVRSVIQAGHSAEAMAARWASFLTGVVHANRSA